MSSLEDDLRRFGAESLVEKLTSRGVSINDILTGNYTPDQLARVIGQEVDRESYGEDILNGVILVLQNQGSRVHHLHSNEENREILGQDTKYHSVRDMLPLLDISSIDINVDAEGIKITKKGKGKGRAVKPKEITGRRVDLYDPLLYQFLRQEGDKIAHLAYFNPNEELPDEKKAIEGQRAIREKFPEFEPLFMLGLKKVHTLESWLFEITQKRVNNLTRRVRAFYGSEEGREFVKEFYEQSFMDSAKVISKRKERIKGESLYDLAPEVISWVLTQDIVKRRDADFVLRAVGAGLICEDEQDQKIKSAMGYWGKIANCISEAARIDYVTRNKLLERTSNVEEVYYPMLREYCENRGRYSGRSLSSSLFAMYGLCKLMRKEETPILSWLLNYQYVYPGSWIINNYRNVQDTVDSIFERKERDFRDIKYQTSVKLCSRAIERDPELRKLFVVYKGTSREKKMSEDSVDMILRRFIRLENEKYKDHFTNRDKSIYLK